MCPRPTKPTFAVVVAISCPPFDHHDVIVAELEVGRADDRINLIRSTEADNRAVDGRIVEPMRRTSPSSLSFSDVSGSSQLLLVH
jgi:hypothetical protein